MRGDVNGKGEMREGICAELVCAETQMIFVVVKNYT